MTADLKALCRCCLEKLDDGQVEITENVKVWFHELVQAQLVDSQQLPNKICPKCVSSLSTFSSLKKKFLNNQKTLLNFISENFQHESSSSPSNPLLNIELSGNDPTAIKIESERPEETCETEFIEPEKEQFEPETTCYPANEENPPSRLKSSTKKLSGARCRFCKKSFSSPNYLTSHVKRVHQGDSFEFKPFKCFSCSIGFESCAGFQNHYDEKHRSKFDSLSCDFCGFQTASKHVLNGHVKSHIIGDRRNRTPAACDQCDAILVSSYQLQVHKKNVHQHSESFKCFCGKTYKWQRSLDYHNKYVHGNATKDHECPVCQHKFNLKSSLVKHMTNLHPKNGERPVHICETCGRSFSYLVALRRHRSVHQEKGFACEHCDKKFSRKENYLNHQAHHQTLAFPCQHCTRSFRINFELQKHLRRVHFKHQVKVKCELCSMWLASKETYRAHVLNKHRDADSMIVVALLDKIEKTVPAKAPPKILS